LTKIEDPFKYVYVVHGTYKEPLPLILKGGLNKMARNHVHMAIGMGKNGVISGMRASCQIVVEVNMVKAIYGQDKISFYVSSNEVILSEGLENGSIPPTYFRSVLDV
jgi:2'-phosphotransferase